MDMADILTARYLVLHEGVFINAALRTVGYILHQRHANALQHTALRLHLRQMRINRRTAVNRAVEIHNLCFAGLQIGFHLSYASHERRRRQHTVLLYSFRQSDIVVHLRSYCNIKQRHGLIRNSIAYLLAIEHNLLGRAIQQACAQLADFAAQTLRTNLNGLAGNIGCTGSVGAGVIRRSIGISTENHNVVKVALQNLGGHLRQNSITACTHISRTNQQCIVTVII